jgi:ABC-type Fe3+ transport system permease subunit
VTEVPLLVEDYTTGWHVLAIWLSIAAFFAIGFLTRSIVFSLLPAVALGLLYVTNPEWIHDFSDGTEIAILSSLIFGAAAAILGLASAHLVAYLKRRKRQRRVAEPDVR